jgi:Ca-activated chloride channel family protein
MTSVSWIGRAARRARSSDRRSVRLLAVAALVAAVWASPVRPAAGAQGGQGGAREVVGPPQAPAGDEGHEIELSSNLVTLIVVVRDATGALVRDLKPQDFVVYEDDVPQEIDRVYRQQELPLRLALLFDASLSVQKRIDFERRAADRFFASALRPGDQAALVSISTSPRLEQGLTSSPAQLASATARLKAEGVTSLFMGIDLAAKTLLVSEGRRVIVILSDGNDTGSWLSAKEALESAQRADAVIYAIGTSGTMGTATPTPLERKGRETLGALCAQTGGSAFFPPADSDRAREAAALDEAYAKLLDEIRAQNVLTYYSSIPSSRSAFRRLRVEAKPHGLSVLARSGYYGKED